MLKIANILSEGLEQMNEFSRSLSSDVALLRRDAIRQEDDFAPISRRFRAGSSSLAIGDKVRVRGDKRIYTITFVSEIGGSFVLTLEHTTLITKMTTTLHTSFLNVEEVVG